MQFACAVWFGLVKAEVVTSSLRMELSLCGWSGGREIVSVQEKMLERELSLRSLNTGRFAGKVIFAGRRHFATVPLWWRMP